MRKRISNSLLTLMVILILVGGTPLMVASAAPPGQEGQEYTIVKGDWLSKLAGRYLDDIFAWPVIMAATNQRSMEDPSFARIKNPNLIFPDQQVWIPGAEEAKAFLTVSVYDGDQLIEISMREAGEPGICTPICFKAIQVAIRELWEGEVPQRNDFRIITACPTPGCESCLDFIIKAKTGEGREGDFKVVLPDGTNIKNLTRENYAFTFIRKSNGEQVKVWVKRGVFPQGFFVKRMKAKFDPEATPKEKKVFKGAVEQLSDKLQGTPLDQLFEIE